MNISPHLLHVVNVGLGLAVLGVLGYFTWWALTNRKSTCEGCGFLCRQRASDWQPHEHLGSARRDNPDILFTPGGIEVEPRGFHREDIPLTHYAPITGMWSRARVELDKIDALWLDARTTAAEREGLTREEREMIMKLPPNYPKVKIMPTIWWMPNSERSWVDRSFEPPDRVWVTVWYEGLGWNCPDGFTLSNWVTSLQYEFENICFLACGRWDLANK